MLGYDDDARRRIHADDLVRQPGAELPSGLHAIQHTEGRDTIRPVPHVGDLVVQRVGTETNIPGYVGAIHRHCMRRDLQAAIDELPDIDEWKATDERG